MKKNIILTIFLLIVFINFKKAYSQYNSTAYYMQNLPQSSLLNPAIQPGCNFYLGFPGFTFDFGNTSLNFDNLVTYLPEADIYIFPLDTASTPEIKNKFLNSLKPVNSFSNYMNVNIFSLGFRADDNYFSFHIAERIETNVDYPDEFFRFFIDGNGKNDIYDWSGFGFRLRAYEEIGLSYSRNISSNFTIGIRGKILFGQADFSTSDEEIFLETDTNIFSAISSNSLNVNVKSKFNVNGSGSIFEIKSVNDQLDKLSLATDLGSSDYIDMLTGMGNLGFGFDLGFDYRPSDRLSLSASALDLGLITWKNNVFNLKTDDEFDFKGIEILFPLSKYESDTSKFFDVLLDSLFSAFEVQSTADPYTTFLTGKVLFGFNYKLTKRLDIGVLSYNQIYRKKIYPRVTFSANARLFKWFHTSFSYSVLNQEYYNMGFGLSFKPGPFNIYVIGDTYPLVLKGGSYVPTYLKSFRFQAGFNLTFGCNKKAQGAGDMPLVEDEE